MIFLTTIKLMVKEMMTIKMMVIVDDGEEDGDGEGDDGGALNYSLCWFKRPRS